MNVVDKATETQIRNIQTKTGKSLDQLAALVQQSSLSKHGEIRAMLQRELGLGFGDANALIHALRKAQEEPTSQVTEAAGNPVDEIYSGHKAPLRPIHDRLMAAIAAFGPFEIAPKKGYISLRRKKQFAMIGPAAKGRVEVGLNIKGVVATERLIAVPSGGMCQYTVKVADAGEVDKELVGWIKQAYDSAG